MDVQPRLKTLLSDYLYNEQDAEDFSTFLENMSIDGSLKVYATAEDMIAKVKTVVDSVSEFQEHEIEKLFDTLLWEGHIVLTREAALEKKAEDPLSELKSEIAQVMTVKEKTGRVNVEDIITHQLMAFASCQTYIIESEMEGEVDKDDPWYPTLQGLWDLQEKFEEEQNVVTIMAETEDPENHEFMAYIDSDGHIVPKGTSVGWEHDAADEDAQPHLFPGIYYAN
jgi:hypothetical protein